MNNFIFKLIYLRFKFYKVKTFKWNEMLWDKPKLCNEVNIKNMYGWWKYDADNEFKKHLKIFKKKNQIS